MKSIEYPITLTDDSVTKSSTHINKKTIYYSLLLMSGVAGFFIPLLFVAFGLLLLLGTIMYCHILYKEISNLDFGSDNYSITLEEIIEDLEG